MLALFCAAHAAPDVRGGRAARRALRHRPLRGRRLQPPRPREGLCRPLRARRLRASLADGLVPPDGPRRVPRALRREQAAIRGEVERGRPPSARPRPLRGDPALRDARGAPRAALARGRARAGDPGAPSSFCRRSAGASISSSVPTTSRASSRGSGSSRSSTAATPPTGWTASARSSRISFSSAAARSSSTRSRRRCCGPSPTTSTSPTAIRARSARSTTGSTTSRSSRRTAPCSSATTRAPSRRRRSWRAVARRLHEEARAVRPDAVYLPNGVEYERFAAPAAPPRDPDLIVLSRAGSAGGRLLRRPRRVVRLPAARRGRGAQTRLAVRPHRPAVRQEPSGPAAARATERPLDRAARLRDACPDTSRSSTSRRFRSGSTRSRRRPRRSSSSNTSRARRPVVTTPMDECRAHPGGADRGDAGGVLESARRGPRAGPRSGLPGAPALDRAGELVVGAGDDGAARPGGPCG